MNWPEQFGGFLAALGVRLGPQLEEPWPGLQDAIKAAADRVLAQNKARVSDPQSETWLVTCSLVLAAYRVLGSHVDDRAIVLQAIQAALTEKAQQRIEDYILERFGISPAAPEDAFQKVAANFKPRGEKRFGDSFHYEQAVQDDTRSFIHIKRCYFNDFFRANGAPEVTPVFCALDYVWADEMQRQKYGVQFERPTTLAQGADTCRFNFIKVEG